MAAVEAEAGGPPPLPPTALDMARQAGQAVDRAIAAGVQRQTLQLMLPINQRRENFMSTEGLDYPCSINAEYEAMSAVTTAVSQSTSLEGEVEEKRRNGGGIEGDPSGIFRMSTGKAAAVVYPISDMLDQIRKIDKEAGPDRTVLIANPQWNLGGSGNVVSDFGFGPWKKAADDFLAQFPTVYSLEEFRIGAPGTLDVVTNDYAGRGGVIRVLYTYPGDWHAYVVGQSGGSVYVTSFPSKPAYKDLEAALDAWKAQGGSTVPGKLKSAGGGSSASEEPAAAPAEGGALTPAMVDALDKATVQKMPTALGKPTSGKLDKLKERLKETLG